MQTERIGDLYANTTEATPVSQALQYFIEVLKTEGKGHKIVCSPDDKWSMVLCTHRYKATMGLNDLPPVDDNAGLSIYLFENFTTTKLLVPVLLNIQGNPPSGTLQRVTIPHGWRDIGIKVDIKTPARVTIASGETVAVVPDSSYDNERPRDKQPDWMFSTYVVANPKDAATVLNGIKRLITGEPASVIPEY